MGVSIYKIGNSVLEIVTCHKDLGVAIDTGLKFHCHVSELVSHSK